MVTHFGEKGTKAIKLNNIIQEVELEIQKYDKHEYYYEKDLLKYFDKLVKSEKPKIFKSISTEFIFTLKQFLNYKWLSIEDIFDILKTTDYHASRNKIRKKINKLHELNLIKKTIPSRLPENPIEPYYKLTSYGLFYLLKDIRIKEDVKNIFKIYGDDDIFRIFIHPLIDKQLLYSLQNIDIIWIFIEYVKQICNRIKDELKVFKIIQKSGKYEEPVVKWDFNLKNDNTRWIEILDRMLFYFFKKPHYKDSKVAPIESPIITDTSITFDLQDNKYNVELDIINEKGKLKFNNTEIGLISIKRKRNYFALYRTRFKDMEEYEHKIKGDFFFYVNEIIKQLVSSLQQLYFKTWDHAGLIVLFEDYRKKDQELEIIAKDDKVKKLLIKFNYVMLKSFKGFLEYSN